MPAVYSYIRHVCGEAEDAATIVEQRKAEECFRELPQDQGLVWGKHFIDASAARKRPLRERSQGRKDV